MHSGFRSEDWVVERTPVNTPVSDRVLVGMINLSDEEASFRGSSEDLCKSSGATTPQESINSNSFGPSTLELTKTETEKTSESKPHLSQESQEASCQEPIPAEEPATIPADPEPEPADEPDTAEKAKAEPEPAKPVSKNGDQPVPWMPPPAGFGDSPEHVPHQKIPGFHEALDDQVSKSCFLF
jgi:outer membrane biosynthesis protein TonB